MTVISEHRAPQLRKRGADGNMQNRSDAVMAQRGIDNDALDDFPTPQWATRALWHHVIPQSGSELQTCLEPAAGRGYMSEVLKEFFARVDSCDIEDYGYCPVLPGGFIAAENPFETDAYDWVITNPPFKLAEDFAREALRVARRGVALLCRTVIIEGMHRYEHLYSVTPPSLIAQYVERVPMVEAQVDPKASTATGYCWAVWDKQHPPQKTYPNKLLQAPLCWIPPCRRQLERPWERINALLIVATNESRKADDIALGMREGTEADIAAHREKAIDRHLTACKELALLKAGAQWYRTKLLLRDIDGTLLTDTRIDRLLGGKI